MFKLISMKLGEELFMLNNIVLILLIVDAIYLIYLVCIRLTHKTPQNSKLVQFYQQQHVRWTKFKYFFLLVPIAFFLLPYDNSWNNYITSLFVRIIGIILWTAIFVIGDFLDGKMYHWYFKNNSR